MIIDSDKENYQQCLNLMISTGLSKDEQQLEQQNVQIREAVYSFLGAIYLQPISEASLRKICDELFLNDLAEVLPGEATAEFQYFLSNLDASSLTNELTALKKTYMSLFAVPTGRYVSPFEDIYRGKTSDGQLQRGPLLGVRAIAAKRLYREAGAQMDNCCRELPNHIGVELSFMHFLCEQEAAALIDNHVTDQKDTDASVFSLAEIYRAYQIRFLREHLTQWFPLLNEEIQSKSDHVFYRSISNMTQAYLQQDLAILKQQFINRIPNGLC